MPYHINSHCGRSEAIYDAQKTPLQSTIQKISSHLNLFDSAGVVFSYGLRLLYLCKSSGFKTPWNEYGCRRHPIVIATSCNLKIDAGGIT